MAFKWPELRHTIEDAGGYKGVKVVLILNPEPLEPLPEGEKYDKEGWNTEWYHSQARVFKSVTIPGEFREDGKELAIDINGDPKVLWELEKTPGFDTRITLQAASAWASLRVTARADAVKN